ncbi:hypothetical protein TNCV_4584411 [Trichonephila clavipes]|nr:hypothetical protein TNCV_4584411 [Trichonephila clavipes]
MQESKTDRRDLSHPPQCTTSHEDRQTVRMAATDHSVTSRTVAHPIESVTHHSEPARTIRRRCNVTSRKHQHLVGFFVDPTPTRASCTCNATPF